MGPRAILSSIEMFILEEFNTEHTERTEAFTETA